MKANNIWAAHAMSDGTFEVVPSTAFKNGERWYSDYVAQNIQNESAARLMAAAPDLLAIAQAAANNLPEGHQKQGWLAVIAKATGGAA